MLVRVAPPPGPKPSLSIAVGPPDEEGCVMVDVNNLEHARAHGWTLRHATPKPVPPPAATVPPAPSVAPAEAVTLSTAPSAPIPPSRHQRPSPLPSSGR